MLIDTAGVNPYSAPASRELRGLVAAAAAEPVMVLPAGGDAVDTMEMARSFRDLGCARMPSPASTSHGGSAASSPPSMPYA